MKKEHEEHLMWVLKQLPDDQQVEATRNFKAAITAGWKDIQFYQIDGPFHYLDLVGHDLNGEYNFIPNMEM